MISGAAERGFFDRALACIEARDPSEKVALTHATFASFQALLAGSDPRAAVTGEAADTVPVRPIPVPGRPDRPTLVLPKDVAQRKLSTPEGRVALVHAVAHIEFNAINLAWDAIYRFRDMPLAFYRDWASVANDEARHFTMLSRRLESLGHTYGDFDAHNGLWEMAVKTEHDVVARMALVPRVLEARGLDVTPAMIERLRSVGDAETAGILEIILREEVAHVAAGSRWFEFACARRGMEPRGTFRELVATAGGQVIRLPFNRAARREAGFSDDELDELEMSVRPGL